MTPMLVLHVYDFLLCCVDAIFLVNFYNYLFGKPEVSRTKFLLHAVLLTVLCNILIQSTGSFSLQPISVVISLPLLFHYKKCTQKKIYFSLILFSSTFIWVMLCDTITFQINRHMTVTLILQATAAYGFMHLGFWALLLAARSLSTPEELLLPKGMWLLLLLIPVASLVALFCTIILAVSQPDERWRLICLPILAAFLFINLILFLLYDRLGRLMSVTKENALIEQQLQFQNKHYQELEKAQNRIRSINHDIRNHMRTASQLAVKNDGNQELIEYLASVSGQVADIESRINTRNPSLDSILNIKISELILDRIPVETDIHLPPGLNLSFEQVVVIFGNLFDNAREACLELAPKRRWVRLQILFANEILVVKLENSTDLTKHLQESLPATTKDDASFHGLGLKNVKSAVEPNGTMNVNKDNGVFTVKIALYGL